MAKVVDDEVPRNKGAGGFLTGFVAVILFISLSTMAAGFGAPNWLEKSEVVVGVETLMNQGLWQLCTQIGTADKSCNSTSSTTNTTWYRISQVLAVLALIDAALSFLFFLYWSCSPRKLFINKVIIIFIMVFGGAMALATTVLVAVEDKRDFDGYDLQWAFYVYSISGPLALVATVCVALIPSSELGPDSSLKEDFFGSVKGERAGYGRFWGSPRPASRGPTRPPMRVQLPPVNPSTMLPKPTVNFLGSQSSIPAVSRGAPTGDQGFFLGMQNTGLSKQKDSPGDSRWQERM